MRIKNSFMIFKCWEIFNICRLHTDPPSLSHLSKKTRRLIHYPGMMREFLFPTGHFTLHAISYLIPCHVSFHLTLQSISHYIPFFIVKIQSVNAVKRTRSACIVEFHIFLSTYPPYIPFLTPCTEDSTEEGIDSLLKCHIIIFIF